MSIDENLAGARVNVQTTIIRPQKGWSALQVGDLWPYRELVYFLTWRDIKVRYKQALLGIGWALIQPILTMLVFTFIFGNLSGLVENGVPYPLFNLAALLPYQLFSGGLSKSSLSLVSNSNLITKVYFPRLAIPLSSVISGLVDFGISLVILFGMMLAYGYGPSWRLLWIIPLTVLAMLTALAFGLWLSALNVQYRDVQHMVPFLTTIWMYISPVPYSSAYILEKMGSWGWIYQLNPIAGVIDGFRYSILGGVLPIQSLLLSFSVVVAVLVGGLFYFRRMEKTFADMV